MVQDPFFYSLTLIFIFKIKVLAFFFFCEYTQKVRHRANITIVIRYEVVYLPSNVVHHDPDLLFKVTNVWNMTISIYQRISQTAIDSRKIPTSIRCTAKSKDCIFSPQILLHFPPFAGGVGNTYSLFFSQTIRLFRFLGELPSRYSRSVKKWMA